jgi:hypothetical protein
MRSTCTALPLRPTLSRRASVSGVATRVRARTFEYESCPRANASVNLGSVARACATRTCSRAAPGDMPTRHASHSARERKPVFQPPRASNSRIRASNRAVAASRWADSSAISSPRRSSSWTLGGEGTKDGRAVTDSAAGDAIWVDIGGPPSARRHRGSDSLRALRTLHPGYRASGLRPEAAIGRKGIAARSSGAVRRAARPRRRAGNALFRGGGRLAGRCGRAVKHKDRHGPCLTARGARA